MVDALIATEDISYFDHAGIDARGTLRALFKLGKGGGASTISQQLAKQLFHGEGSRNTLGRITQKIKEWVIATRLEKQYTKEGVMYWDQGNSAEPIADCRCCNKCNDTIVTPARVTEMIVQMNGGQS